MHLMPTRWPSVSRPRFAGEVMRAFLTKAKQPMEEAFPGLYRVLRVISLVGWVLLLAFGTVYLVELIGDRDFSRNVSVLFAQRNLGFIALFILNWVLIPFHIYVVVLLKKHGSQVRMAMLSICFAPVSNLARLSCKVGSLPTRLDSFQTMSFVVIGVMVLSAWALWLESLGKKREELVSASDSA